MVATGRESIAMYIILYSGVHTISFNFRSKMIIQIGHIHISKIIHSIQKYLILVSLLKIAPCVACKEEHGFTKQFKFFRLLNIFELMLQKY